MERGSSKHSQHLDELLAQEARDHTQGGPAGSRARESRESEPAGEDQPEPRWIPEGARPDGAPAPLTGEELEARSRLGRYLPRSALPADRRALVRAAEEMDAPADVRADLERLPKDRSFDTVYEVWAALGHRNES